MKSEVVCFVSSGTFMLQLDGFPTGDGVQVKSLNVLVFFVVLVRRRPDWTDLHSQLTLKMYGCSSCFRDDSCDDSPCVCVSLSRLIDRLTD